MHDESALARFEVFATVFAHVRMQVYPDVCLLSQSFFTRNSNRNREKLDARRICGSGSTFNGKTWGTSCIVGLETPSLACERF